MKILEVKSLAIPEVKVITYGRFADDRGYFTEHFRKSDFDLHPDIAPFLSKTDFVQSNESFSKKGTFRGFHFQWNPYQGKLVRPIYGHLIDFALDIRKNSPTFGKIVALDMPANTEDTQAQWIWLPPGFAHGVLFPEDSMIEYFCTGQYSPGNEACLSPFAKDIDWSLCDPKMKHIFDDIMPKTELITEKDRNGFTLAQWLQNPISNEFIYKP